METSLDDFIEEMKMDIAKFETEYRKKSESHPEEYPLALDNNNAGLWAEFFMSYMCDGYV